MRAIHAGTPCQLALIQSEQFHPALNEGAHASVHGPIINL